MERRSGKLKLLLKDMTGAHVSHIPYALFQITTFCVISCIITLLVIAFYMQKKWKKNWDEYRCSLTAIPFAGFINPKESMLTNLDYCVKKKTQPMIKAYTKYKLDSAAAAVIKENENAIKEAIKTEKTVNEAKEETKSMFSGLFEMFNRMLQIFKYSTHSIQNLFFKIGAIIWTLYHLLITQINTISIQIAQFQRLIVVVKALAIFAAAAFVPLIPLSAILIALIIVIDLEAKAAEKRAYCCFTPETIIDTQKGKTSIQDISLGDSLSGGGTVTGIVSLLTPNTPVIQLGANTCVTCDHLLLNNNRWQHVDELFLGNYSKTKFTNGLMCLVTTNNIIKSGGITFRDYEEVRTEDIQCKIAGIILQSLNNSNTHLQNLLPKYELGERNNCLPGQTKVRLLNGDYQRIDSIDVGTITSCGKVLGIYKCITKNIEWFNVNGTIVSPRVICKPSPQNFVINKVESKGSRFSSDFQGWSKAYNIGEYSPISNNDFGYHLILESRHFELENGLFVRDFVESDDEIVQDFITKIVLTDLNKYYNEYLSFINNTNYKTNYQNKDSKQFINKGRCPSF